MIPLDFSFRLQDGQDGLHALVATLQGEIDLSNAPLLQARLEETVDQGWHVIVDLTDVTYLDLQGIHALEAAQRRAQARGLMLVLAASHPHVHRVLEITGVPTIVTTVSTVAQALDALDGH